MRPATVTLVLARRDPARYLGLALAVIGVGILPAAPPESPSWIALLVAPVFPISVALSLPDFSSFELALPVTQSQLLWSRILASLTIVSLPLLAGVPATLLRGKPLAGLRQPAEFAFFFTACVCLATAARLSSRPIVAGIYGVPAFLCWILASRSLPWQAALALTGLATLPVAGSLWPDRTSQCKWPRAVSFTSLLWPPFRLIWSWQTLLFVPLAFWFGLDLSWGFLMFTSLFLTTDTISKTCVLGLPVPRRHILWALLIPMVLPFLIGVAFSNRFHDPESIANFTQPSEHAAWRDFDGNPPGLMVPPYYYRRSPGLSQTVMPQQIAAPWGETTQVQGSKITAALGPTEFIYDPYWVAPDNSDRFFEWQFVRATREIYGKALRPAELRTAIRDGLRPVTEQPRMLILRMAFGASSLLVNALLFAICDWYRLRAIPRRVRTLAPFVLPLSIFLAAQLVIPYWSTSWPQRGLLRLSAILPANLVLMTLALLAALAPLYWALETVFNQVEFPGQTKETV